ncbi:MAG TPA: hypothetical protein PLM16_02090 [Candidatus Woesebacteria bacterium]|nr:hypothetical protein [Candidatus Woesebacteria bacterium]
MTHLLKLATSRVICLILGGLLVVNFFSGVSKRVLAQENSTQPEQSAETDQLDLSIDESSAPAQLSNVILQKERLAEEIQDQHRQLLGQLNQYQHDERQYRVALDQYQRLQTLSSIEEVVTAARQLILSRNLALQSYLNLLRLKLIEAEGIEITHKNQVVVQIESLLELLKEHSAQALNITQREEINQLAESFQEIYFQIRSTSYYGLSILEIGKLQAVYDQAVVINQRIQMANESDSKQEASRERALLEVNKLIKELPQLFSNMWVNVTLAQEKNDGYESLYRFQSQDLNLAFARLSRLIAYFEELEGISR